MGFPAATLEGGIWFISKKNGYIKTFNAIEATHPNPQPSVNSTDAAKAESTFTFWKVHIKLVLPLPQPLTTSAQNSFIPELSPKERKTVIQSDSPSSRETL